MGRTFTNLTEGTWGGPRGDQEIQKKKKKGKSTPTPRTECPCDSPGGQEAPGHLTVRVQRSRVGWGTGIPMPGAPPKTLKKKKPEIWPKEGLGGQKKKKKKNEKA